MKIYILTAGSRGDVQPYVALGKGLKKAGHEVTVCTCVSFRQFIVSNGLDYGYMNDDFMKLIDSEAGRKAMESGSSFFGLMKTMAVMFRESKGITRRMLRDAWEAARKAGPDLMVFHPKSMAGIHLAEKLEIPGLMALPVPIMVPTSEFPAIGFPRLGLGRWYNRLSYRILHKGYHSYDSVINEFRRETLGLGKYPRSAKPYETSKGESITVLHGYSESVWPRPRDWPEKAMVAGYWFLDSEEGEALSPELETFLEKGDPPVCVGFGSMSGRNPRKTADTVVEALQIAGVRGVLLSGWGGLEPSELPDTVFQVEQAPYDLLFPRMSAVVHHGGAGTTAEGLRAGKPTVICPFLIDQPVWGERVHLLGAGPKPIPQKNLTPEKLAIAIREATSSSLIGKNASELGKKLREEGGIARAVKIIEQVAVAG